MGVETILDLCHRTPERMTLPGGSLTLFCARCTGLFLGSGFMLLLALVTARARPLFGWWISLAMLALLVVDVSASILALGIAGNTTRFLSGWLGGGALTTIAILLYRRPSGATRGAGMAISSWLGLGIGLLFVSPQIETIVPLGWLVYTGTILCAILRLHHSVHTWTLGPFHRHQAEIEER